MKQSFTLIELIVVIVIIAVLVAVIAPNVVRAIEKAKISSAIANLKTGKTAILNYYADVGKWPPRYDTNHPGTHVNYLIENPGLPGWDGSYIDVWPPHPWGGQVGFSYRLIHAVVHKHGGRFACKITLDDDRPFTDASNGKGKVPDESMFRIDELMDDGSLTTNDVQRNTNASGNPVDGELTYYFTG